MEKTMENKKDERNFVASITLPIKSKNSSYAKEFLQTFSFELLCKLQIYENENNMKNSELQWLPEKDSFKIRIEAENKHDFVKILNKAKDHLFYTEEEGVAFEEEKDYSIEYDPLTLSLLKNKEIIMEQNKLETTLKQIEEWADKAGFQTSYDKESNTISFEAWNSYDKDIFEEFNFDKDDPMSFMEDLQERIDSYDVSEESSLWLDSQGHGKNGAPYDIEELLESSKEELRMLQDLYDHIEYKGESRREHFFNPEKAAACYTTLDNYREVSGFLDFMRQITRLKDKPYGHDIGDIFKEAYTNYPLTSRCGKNDMNVIGNWLASVCVDNKFDQKEFFAMIEKNISPSVNLEKENGKIQTTSAQTKQKKLAEPSRGR